MRSWHRLEYATRSGTCRGVEYVVVAVLYDIGFACISEIAIEGCDPISYPSIVGRQNTLEHGPPRFS